MTFLQLGSPLENTVTKIQYPYEMKFTEDLLEFFQAMYFMPNTPDNLERKDRSFIEDTASEDIAPSKIVSIICAVATIDTSAEQKLALE